MSDELTLEKLRVKERLESVEEHMRIGEENRKTLMLGFEKLEETVGIMRKTLFGQYGEDGIIQKINSMIKVADGIKTILTRIFISICSAIVFALLPKIFGYLSQVLAHHQGG